MTFMTSADIGVLELSFKYWGCTTGGSMYSRISWVGLEKPLVGRGMWEYQFQEMWEAPGTTQFTAEALLLETHYTPTHRPCY